MLTDPNENSLHYIFGGITLLETPLYKLSYSIKKKCKIRFKVSTVVCELELILNNKFFVSYANNTSTTNLNE